MTITRNDERGYTLVELMVVIVLLGFLTAVVIPQIINFMGKGQVEAAAAETSIVQKAMHEYMIGVGLTSVEAQETPVQLLASSPGAGQYLDTNTGWTYTWNESGIVSQASRVD